MRNPFVFTQLSITMWGYPVLYVITLCELVMLHMRNRNLTNGGLFEACRSRLAVKKLQKISFFNAILFEFSKMAVADEVTVKGSAISMGNMVDFDEKSDENSNQTALKSVFRIGMEYGGNNFQDFVPILCIFFTLIMEKMVLNLRNSPLLGNRSFF